MASWAAVLAGGSGTRFWPLSTEDRPKQLLPLVGAAPLLKQAVARLEALIPADRILVVTGRRFLDEARSLLPSLPSENLLGEPRAASTAPALAWATEVARRRDPEATVLSLHADWYVGDDEAFRATAGRALDVAREHDLLVTVGVEPTRPEIGYGYIVPGEPLTGDARRVARFVEKPDCEAAERLIAEGGLWNSGLFAWTAKRFRAETEAHAPELAPALSLLEADQVERFFESVTPIAVDISHFERSDRVAVLPGRFPWDDVGTWSALRRVRASDARGNVAVGDTFVHGTYDSVGWSDEGVLVLDGLRDVVVVQANGITLVTTTERAAHLKELLELLPEEIRRGRT
ncbi:MAG: mannose-1-phosphate guanylyltransferase [Gemmatimonadales bacterium]